MKIYHNPRCSKSRQTLTLIVEAGIDPEIVLYMNEGISVSNLRNLVEALGLSSPRELVRKGEKIYRNLELNSVSDEIILKTMSTYPQLIERPIVIKAGKAVLGRPPENVKSLFAHS